MNPRAKELISALLKNINEEKATVKSYKAKEEELKMKVKMLNIRLMFETSFARSVHDSEN